MDGWGLEWMISVDDHVLEPAGVWQDRVPAALRLLAPRHVRDDEGEAWIYNGDRYPTYGLSAVAGKDAEEFSLNPLTYEDMRAGCYDPKARVEDMNQDHVLASAAFPSFPRFAGQLFSLTPNRELGLACVQAYNDWMIDEWCAAAPGRLIPMVIMPMWDGRVAAAELERCAGKGAKAFTFSENPQPLGFPSIHDSGHWGPLFSAANDTGLPICTHIGSSSQLRQPSTDSPEMATMSYTNVAGCAATLVDWLFSGYFLKFPNLKLCLSEGGIGWIPYVLERAEQVFDKQRHWLSRADAQKGGYNGEERTPGSSPQFQALLASGRRPRELFRDHVFGCFVDDRCGLALLDEIGVDNVMVESDYPHSDSNWPRTMDVIRPQIAHRTEEEQLKILQQNAIRVFNLVPPPMPAELASALTTTAG